jgi:hypothetical protein
MGTLHSQLCVTAAKWLRRPESKGGPGCLVAVSECQAADSGEIPDAIGFRCVGWEQHSVLVEVKVTRGDFLADAKKPHRVEAASGLGVFRYYMAPEGLIAPAELPPRWGLVEVSSRAVKVRVGHVLEPRVRELNWQKNYEAWKHSSNRNREMSLLVKMLARVGDMDTYQRELKIARNLFSRTARTAEAYRQRADAAERDLWLLRNRLEDAGIELPDAPSDARVRRRAAFQTGDSAVMADAQESTKIQV